MLIKELKKNTLYKTTIGDCFIKDFSNGKAIIQKTNGNLECSLPFFSSLVIKKHNKLNTIIFKFLYLKNIKSNDLKNKTIIKNNKSIFNFSKYI